MIFVFYVKCTVIVFLHNLVDLINIKVGHLKPCNWQEDLCNTMELEKSCISTLSVIICPEMLSNNRLDKEKMKTQSPILDERQSCINLWWVWILVLDLRTYFPAQVLVWLMDSCCIINLISKQWWLSHNTYFQNWHVEQCCLIAIICASMNLFYFLQLGGLLKIRERLRGRSGA